MELDSSGQLTSTILSGILIIMGAGTPVIAFFLIKDVIKNIVAGLEIKLNSNYQYVNDFEFEGRKNCRIVDIGFTKVTIQDLATEQIIVIYNKDFVSAKIWKNHALRRRKEDA